MDIAFIFLGCALGCALNTVCGFGFGVVGMMFLPYVMGSTVQAATVINAVTFLQAAVLAVRYRRHIRWRLLFTPMAAYFIASIAAVRLAVGMDNELMKRVLGAFLLALSGYFIFAAKRVRMRANVRNGLIAGTVGGIMSGMFATGGPPASLYFSATTETKEEYLATIQAYFTITNFYVVAVRALNGAVTTAVVRAMAVGAAGLLLGNLLGEMIFKRVDVDFIRKGIYVMMALSGAVMLFT